MKIFLHKLFLSLLFINLLSLLLCDSDKKLKSIELNEKIKGKMNKDDSREYYELKLPKEIPPESLLIFTVKESRKGIKDGEELFSDPDIYISKTRKYPSNREEAEWFSERYGNDILTIPSYAGSKEEIFYICMYCQYKCRYELTSYLSKEVPATIGKYYTFSISKKSSINYALYVPENQNKEELNVIAYNPSLSNIRIFMAKESPSSQNTFQIIPTWNGGYLIPVSKFNTDYCTNCTYHILFQTEEEEQVDIQFTAYFQSTLTQIKTGNPINDAVKGGEKRCYYFDTSNTDNLYNSKLIISVNLFSGSAILGINGWIYNTEERNRLIIKDDSYIYSIENDKNVLLQKEDFEKFDKKLQNSDSETGTKKLYFCINGQLITSYVINIYFLSDVQSLQRFIRL